MSTQPNQTPSSASVDGEQLVTIRRAPSLLAFAITGGLLGVILAGVLSLLNFTGPAPVEHLANNYSRGAVFGILAVTLGAAGAALATAIALLLDRRSAKHAETVRAIPADRID
ncbi:hypothetical protein VVR12_05335 [Rothia sp. LK2588]|uniref:hypothetical protein n=1 Tax=Rothia sp. LK2588 TaxID=3114369 RepID=UPI0034CE35AC